MLFSHDDPQLVVLHVISDSLLTHVVCFGRVKMFTNASRKNFLFVYILALQSRTVHRYVSSALSQYRRDYLLFRYIIRIYS